MNNQLRYLRSLIAISINYTIDYYKFMRHSAAFSINTLSKLEGQITYTYHSIEKGLSMSPIRLGFGRKKILILSNLLSKYVSRGYETDRSQFIAACSVLYKYYLLHHENKFDINDFFTSSLHSLVTKYAKVEIGGVISYRVDDYFNDSQKAFELFSKSRHSIRYFKDLFISTEIVEKAIEIAKSAPSVCNRQSTKVHLVENKEFIKVILEIQKGISTFDNFNQILVITGDRSYFFTSGERSQLFFDSGIFLQNLLYSFHYLNVGACPLHWSVNFQSDKIVGNMLNLQKSEKIVCLVAIGVPSDEFKLAASPRKNTYELLSIHK